MAQITAAMVKELRERTGAPMGDCKSALVEADGDQAKALEVLQKKGAARAVKAAGKTAAEGAVLAKVAPDGAYGVLVEVNCQTDFVARGEDFKTFAETVAKHAVASGATDTAALEAVTESGRSLKEHGEALTAKSGEKHAVGRVARFDAEKGKGYVTSYVHHGEKPNGLAVLVELTSEKGVTPEVKELADQIALQVASMGPQYVRREDVPAEVITKQREIMTGQLKEEDDGAVREYEEWKARMAEWREPTESDPDFNQDAYAAAKSEHEASEEGAPFADYNAWKASTLAERKKNAAAVKQKLGALEKKAKTVQARPAEVAAKIIEGKVNKGLADLVLLEQGSVVVSNKTIAQVLTEFAAKHGKVDVKRIARFKLGEGVEQAPAKDFAQEVAEMAAAAQQRA